jgi:phosphohistidine phosphatase
LVGAAPEKRGDAGSLPAAAGFHGARLSIRSGAVMECRDLLLLRHADAAEAGAAGDFARCLTDRGRRQAVRIARVLQRKAVVPDRVVASPAARALETAQLAVRELGLPGPSLREDPALYEADTLGLLEAVARHGQGCRRLLLVGHNPGLKELAEHLAAGTTDDFALPRAAVAHLQPAPARPPRLDAGCWLLTGLYEPA